MRLLSSSATTSKALGRHVSDLTLGLALLGYPLGQDALGDLYRRVEGRLGEMAVGDVSSLAWAWDKLATPGERMPAALEARTRGEAERPEGRLGEA